MLLQKTPFDISLTYESIPPSPSTKTDPFSAYDDVIYSLTLAIERECRMRGEYDEEAVEGMRKYTGYRLSHFMSHPPPLRMVYCDVDRALFDEISGDLLDYGCTEGLYSLDDAAVLHTSFNDGVVVAYQGLVSEVRNEHRWLRGDTLVDACPWMVLFYLSALHEYYRTGYTFRSEVDWLVVYKVYRIAMGLLLHDLSRYASDNGWDGLAGKIECARKSLRDDVLNYLLEFGMDAKYSIISSMVEAESNSVHRAL